MDKQFRLLDCTLRDGCHITGGCFGEETIRKIIERLVEANADIIEVGFLWDKPFSTDYAKYYTIADVKKILPKCCGNSKFSLMADFIDLDHLEPCDGTIEYIRLSFKRWRLDWGIITAKLLMDKGYKVFINPVNNNVYTDKQYIEVLDKVNELHPYGFSIVDTFGTMWINDLSHRYYLVENNLLPDITIGVHLHENLGLAYSLAQHITKIANPTRKIVIDGSLLGMGRVPGNLCMEQFMEYMNEQFGTSYNIEPVYDAIDDYIAPIKQEKPWGYAIPYALSAKYHLHRTYAEYLINTRRLKNKDIQRILSKIPQSEAETYNKDYIEKLFLDYLNVEYDSAKDIEYLRDFFSKYMDYLIIAPGSSIRDKIDTLKELNTKETCVLSVNFDSSNIGITPDYIFVTNTKRIDAINTCKRKTIVTSNLVNDVERASAVISYNDLAYTNGNYCNDSTIMLINLLKITGIKKTKVAGFDGKRDGSKNYYDNSFDRNTSFEENESHIKYIVDDLKEEISIDFITESIYQ